MTIGIDIKKQLADGRSWHNRYYCTLTSPTDALDVGNQIAILEAGLFADDVTITQVHTWVVGADPNQFANRFLNIPGQIISAYNIPLFICSGVQFELPNSYPSYKRFRGHYPRLYLDGEVWGTSLTDRLTTFVDGMDELLIYLCNQAGNVFTGINFTNEVFMLQEKKAWYNRTS